MSKIIVIFKNRYLVLKNCNLFFKFCRYIVCKWLKPDIRDICDYMYEINGILDKYSSSTSNTDINEVVPLHVLKNDEAFFEYIVKSNNL